MYKPTLDRGDNVGNSPGDDGRGRIHTKVSNKLDEPVPIAGSVTTDVTGYALESTQESVLATAQSIDSKLAQADIDLSAITGLISDTNTLLRSVTGNIDTTLSSRASEATLLIVDGHIVQGNSLLSNITGHITSIDAHIDTNLSTRASEATLQSISGKVSSIDAHIDTNLSSRASESTLLSVSGHVTTIDSHIDTNLSSRASEATLQSISGHVTIIDGHIDTNLSTRASEATLQGISGKIASIDSHIDVNLSTRASEATLQSISGHITTIDSHIDVNTSTRASEATLQSISGHITAIDAHIDTTLSSRASEATLLSISGHVTSLDIKITDDFGATSGAIRTAAQVGNVSGGADFNAGATSAQTLRTAANNYDGSGNALTSRSYASVRPIDAYLPQLGASTATNTRVTPTANTSTQILAANPNRKWVFIENQSGANFFMRFGAAAVINEQIEIPNGTNYTMDATMLYLGAINVIVGSNNRTIGVVEGS